MPVFMLDENLIFPSPELAEDDGLLAVGGDLSPERIILAYKNGIFPWYSAQDPILWWSPNPRCVLFPHKIHVSKSLKRLINKNIFKVTFNKNFESIINTCSYLRAGNTWLIEDMIKAYTKLFYLGYGMSVEVWDDGEIVGGLYGIILGKCFFAESMFSIKSNTSKIAMVKLCELLIKKNFAVIDCQVSSPHLHRMGAENIPRKDFLQILKENIC
jgi:leucyl/phenylalanyl-tRNA--protein transferase